uniref:C-type lectin domain-containing protein n=1 Tax=Kryptolebias marmoratus TaxID=37003 RepID=A0A3Q3AKN6_KRYMA
MLHFFQTNLRQLIHQKNVQISLNWPFLTVQIYVFALQLFRWIYRKFLISNTFSKIWSFFSGTNVTFVFIDQLMTWLDAQMYCREHHTDLASIRSLAENEKIRTLKPAGLYVWFGLYKDAWKWSDGPLFIYQHWKYAPSGRLKKCAAADFGSSGFWTDWQCDQKKAFICHHGPPED